MQNLRPKGYQLTALDYMRVVWGLGHLYCKSVSTSWTDHCIYRSQLQWCVLQHAFVRPLTLIDAGLRNFVYNNTSTGNPARDSKSGDWSLREWFLSQSESAARNADARTYGLVTDMVISYVTTMAETGRCAGLSNKLKRDVKRGLTHKTAKKLKKEIDIVKALTTNSTSQLVRYDAEVVSTLR